VYWPWGAGIVVVVSSGVTVSVTVTMTRYGSEVFVGSGMAATPTLCFLAPPSGAGETDGLGVFAEVEEEEVLVSSGGPVPLVSLGLEGNGS